MIIITASSVIRGGIPTNAAGSNGTVDIGWGGASRSSMPYRSVGGALSGGTRVLFAHGVGGGISAVVHVNGRRCSSGPMIRLSEPPRVEWVADYSEHRYI